MSIIIGVFKLCILQLIKPLMKFIANHQTCLGRWTVFMRKGFYYFFKVDFNTEYYVLVVTRRDTQCTKGKDCRETPLFHYGDFACITRSCVLTSHVSSQSGKHYVFKSRFPSQKWKLGCLEENSFLHFITAQLNN